MDSNSTTEQVIASALQLPVSERFAVVNALQESLIDETIEHGSGDPADEVAAAWKDEIGRRIDGIDSGRVKTIPSEEAWKIINGDAPPEL